MQLENQIDWTDNTIDFVNYALYQNLNLEPSIAITKVLMEASRLSMAACTFVVNADGKVIAASRFTHSTYPLPRSLFFQNGETQYTDGFLKKTELTELPQFLQDLKVFWLLIIPNENSDGSLIFGFRKKPNTIKSLINFGRVVKTFCENLLQKIEIAAPNPTMSHILDNLPAFACAINEKQIITYFNSFAKETLTRNGIAPKLGQPFPIHGFEETYPINAQPFIEKALNGDLCVSSHTTRPDDKCFEFSFMPIKNESSSISQVIIVGNDVSSRVNAEKKARHESQLLNGILQNLPVIIFRISPQGKILELAGAGLDKLDVEKIKKQNAFVAFPGLRTSSLHQDKPDKTRFLMRGKDGKKEWIFEAYTFLDKTLDGGIVGFAMDISDQGKVEMELKKAKDFAERANLAKSYFLANQSHEIRTPINTILGFAEVLKTNQNPEKQGEFIDLIISSSQNLLTLLGNVLDLTKIEEGKLDLQEEPFDLEKSVQTFLKPFAFKAEQKKICFTFSLDKNLPRILSGDSGKLSQIITNLVSNSLKFTESGEIKVSFHGKPLNGKKNILLQIIVSDTGIGIPQKKQKAIFQNFTQADNSIGKKFGGFGLGLSIVKKLVKFMKGSLKVESPGEFQKGSTFRVELPMKIIEESTLFTDELSTSEVIFEEKVNVLLVDDNYLNLQLGEIMLSKMGAKVVVAQNGKQAIKELETHDFDLILMDVQMPVLDGYQTTRKIRENLKLDTPIIGLSASSLREDIDFCFKCGMNDYLGRPYTKKSFQEKVYNWASSKFLSKREKLTNLGYLEDIFNGDKKMIEEVVGSFIQHQECIMSELEAALLNGNYPIVASTSHKIRSSLQTVGLTSLFTPLEELENLAHKNGNKSLLQQRFTTIQETLKKAKEELLGSLSNS